MKEIKDLASVSKEEQLDFFNSFDTVISDIDGVLLMVTKQIPGSNDALNSMRGLGKRVKLLSNNNMRSLSECHKNLLSEGIDIEKDDVIIPMLGMINYLQEIGFDKEIFLIGSKALKEELQNAGFKIADPGPCEVAGLGREILQHFADKETIGAVIVDADVNVNFIRLQMAISYLRRPDVVFIVGATDKRLPIGNGLIISGPGYFLDPILDITGRTPVHLAKPGNKLNEYIVKKWNITDPSKVLFIGDSVAEDMAFATNAGYKKLLVLSGATKSLDWTHPEEYKPDYYLKSFPQLHSIIKNL